jgi:hypothetical protein
MLSKIRGITGLIHVQFLSGEEVPIVSETQRDKKDADENPDSTSGFQASRAISLLEGLDSASCVSPLRHRILDERAKNDR